MDIETALGRALRNSLVAVTVERLIPAGRVAPERAQLRDRQALAREIAAARGIQYRSALRNLQRYTTTATQRRAPRAPMVELIRQFRLPSFAGGMLVNFTGQYTPMGDPKYARPHYQRHFAAVIPPERLGWMRTYTADRAAGADEFAVALLDAYGAPWGTLYDIDRLEVRPV